MSTDEYIETENIACAIIIIIMPVTVLRNVRWLL